MKNSKQTLNCQKPPIAHPPGGAMVYVLVSLLEKVSMVEAGLTDSIIAAMMSSSCWDQSTAVSIIEQAVCDSIHQIDTS